jgi:hypothetical protein
LVTPGQNGRLIANISKHKTLLEYFTLSCGHNGQSAQKSSAMPAKNFGYVSIAETRS